ncbi:IgGFc-binding protein-like [Xenia sp. Carnegie-2017]|uniref:IgGFc-binding protein-like n=1 Tax=Xenia sp. Carnegie-2017 TaxID=2897299 RepID=UPI001F03A75A|nr:IgGFc-binding protein-like [Xenia sp. Carnegie-2017]
MSTSWNSRTYVKVTVSGKYKGKICSTSLCGNNNGRRDDDNQYSRKCASSSQPCIIASQKKAVIDKCHLMSDASSPFHKACNRYVDPAALISNCKYDACRCTDPMKCVCNAFAAYSKLCVEYGGVIDWRFNGTYLYPKLKECEKTCSNKGEIFTECGSACAKTCRDISRGLKCSERCIPGCQCPKGSYLDEKNHCVPMKECPCFFEGNYYKAGESVKVGRCKTCTCNTGAMACVEDRNCSSKSPCESFPCKNDGGCLEEGDTFSCICINGYHGKTCEELPPTPCDSRPCKNNGICSINGDTFSCECAVGFEGNTCEVTNACAKGPCKNEGVCTIVGSSYKCECKYGFTGKNCEVGVCDHSPCKNGGSCVVDGSSYKCTCPPDFIGIHCETTTCIASGDPHYTSFDGKRFNFMGDFRTKIRCGRRVTCTAAVKIYIAGYFIQFTRQRRSAVVNGVRLSQFPIVRPGFKITNPSGSWLVFTADIGMSTSWNSRTYVKVTVSGKYKGKICSTSLCGNNNGRRDDDNQYSRKCASSSQPCIIASQKKAVIDKCHLMSDASSPFHKACNRYVDPAALISNCKYDACRCTDPMKCVCNAFAAYSKLCVEYGGVIDWRFNGTYLYPKLKECEKTCSNKGEIFTECGSACAKTCRDISRGLKCSERCIPGCQCPKGSYLDEKNHCVPMKECPCFFEGNYYKAGESVKVGRCKTCTCNTGAMACVEDRNCSSKSPCESFPCKNDGGCLEEGDTFSCICINGYHGKTCEELPPTPCDSRPCKNNGICSINGDTFSCECAVGFEGNTCEVTNACAKGPCKNEGVCTIVGSSYKCECKYGFTGKNCEVGVCDHSPCKNGGSCVVDGSSYKCTCPPDFIGIHCETKVPNPCEPNPCKMVDNATFWVTATHVNANLLLAETTANIHNVTTCIASGDPHYTSFDGKRFNFMGDCEYDFAKDCSENKLFTVRTKNTRCGRRVTCTAAVKIYIAGYFIQFTRQRRSAVVNGVRLSQFPIVRPGFKITNPSGSWLVFTADIGMSTSWNSRTYVKVTVSGKYKGKICSTSLCGNNNGRRDDDNQYSRKCASSSQPCIIASQKKAVIDKCHLMSDASSPFHKACNRYVDPAALISNCKYDACRCTDPMKCVCNAFAAYSKLCVEYGGVIDWRFNGTYLYPKLKECEKTCSNKGEIFTECGSACAKTCRDISRGLKCTERCIPGCQCPKGSYLDEKNHCVPMKECPCFFEGNYYKAGESVKVGRCKTCTCNTGAMACVEDRNCSSKSPCESFPCKNDGGCLEEGDTFSCICINGYHGKTCEELPPTPCDSRPCKNNGICSINGDTFSCECAIGFEGNTCEVTNACAKGPCKNEGVCTIVGSSYKCECKYGFTGKNCEVGVCDHSPCKNGGSCVVDGSSYKCTCPPDFIGIHCETKVPNPCEPNPCKNGGQCNILGNSYTCKCKPAFGGNNCEYSQSTCIASGDPHYTSFDGKRFNFMGDCEYDFAKDCSENKLFTVRTKNTRCGRRVTCTAAVKIYIAGYFIQFTRQRRSAVVNGVRLSQFPIVRPGFKITNPSGSWLVFTADIEMSTSWNSRTYVKVTVSGKYKGKICSTSLCGNNNGRRDDDNQYSRKCASSSQPCIIASQKKAVIDKCHLMSDASSPFHKACNRYVDPAALISNCKYDACRCTDPMKCVCNAFAAYSKLCVEYGGVIDWRFNGTYLYPKLKECEKTCSNKGEIFTECGSACAKTCRDISRGLKCNERCIPGCQCPKGSYLDEKNHCVPMKECPCFFEGNYYKAGESVKVGRCKTCTCNTGAMACVEDRNCSSKSPCESFPCKNDGGCLEEGDTFSCICINGYHGKTCEELPPTPCDSRPCKKQRYLFN